MSHVVCLLQPLYCAVLSMFVSDEWKLLVIGMVVVREKGGTAAGQGCTGAQHNVCIVRLVCIWI